MSKEMQAKLQRSLAVLVVLTFVMVGCSRGGGETKTPGQAEGKKNTLDKILETKKVKIGIMPTIPRMTIWIAINSRLATMSEWQEKSGKPWERKWNSSNSCRRTGSRPCRRVMWISACF